MAPHRQKLVAQVETELLAAIRDVAARDGRRLQAVVEDAFRVYLDERRRERPRRRIMDTCQVSHNRYASLYEHLTK